MSCQLGPCHTSNKFKKCDNGNGEFVNEAIPSGLHDPQNGSCPILFLVTKQSTLHGHGFMIL